MEEAAGVSSQTRAVGFYMEARLNFCEVREQKNRTEEVRQR